MILSRLKIFYVFSSVIIFLSLTAFEENRQSVFHSGFLSFFRNHSSKLNLKIIALNNEVKSKRKNTETAKQLLAEARAEYKSIEAFVIYFLPHESRYLNRAIILEMEKDERISDIIEPHGFQYLEKMLYSDSVNYFREKITAEIGEISKVMTRVNAVIGDYTFNEQNIFEAIQMQLIRQFMLGFTEFETPHSRHGISESQIFLKYTKELLQCVIPTDDPYHPARTFYESLDEAVIYLGEMNKTEEKDYFKFYSEYYIPLSKNFVLFHERVAGKIREYSTPVNLRAGSIFDPGAFNSFNFIYSKNFRQREKVVDLGRVLFFDPVLSDNNQRACASCHRPEKGFTDGLSQSLAFDQDNNLLRNAPTLINSVFQKRLFLDGRSQSFEDQAFRVLSNPDEMHHDFNIVAGKIKASPDYHKLFNEAFEGTRDTAINRLSILTAISEYERTLIGMNSRFDKAINGERTELSDEEKSGFNLFVGKGNCASCHFIPLFNGTFPPEYLETEWETLGVPVIGHDGVKSLDPDSGRGGIVIADILRHAFKTPTVRNAEVTGPYMHNGVFKTLEEVIDFYNVGGGRGMGLDVPYQTLSPDSLHLSDKEKSQLVSFIKSLTDTVNLTGRPARLPVFPGDAQLNKRPVGGVY